MVLYPDTNKYGKFSKKRLDDDFLEKSADTLKKLFTITDMAVDYYKIINFMNINNS